MSVCLCPEDGTGWPIDRVVRTYFVEESGRAGEQAAGDSVSVNLAGALVLLIATLSAIFSRRR
jgi:hypothetical protein